MMRRDKGLLITAFLAGAMVGAIALFSFSNYPEAKASLTYLRDHPEAFSTIVAAMIAVGGVAWQMGKTRKRDHENFQYKVLHECRYNIILLARLLEDRVKLLEASIEKHTPIDMTKWRAVPGETWSMEKLYSVVGDLLSISSRLGVAINQNVTMQNTLREYMDESDFSDEQTAKMLADLKEIKDHLAPWMTIITEAYRDNKLPKYPSSIGKLFKR